MYPSQSIYIKCALKRILLKMRNISFFYEDAAIPVSSFCLLGCLISQTQTSSVLSLTKNTNARISYVPRPFAFLHTFLPQKSILWILGWRDKAYCWCYTSTTQRRSIIYYFLCFHLAVNFHVTSETIRLQSIVITKSSDQRGEVYHVGKRRN